MANAHKYIVFGILFLLIYSSCVSIEKVKTGEQALDRKQYSVAKELLIKEYEQAKGSDKAQKAYLLGDAHYMTNEMSQALKWYEESYKRGFSTPYSLWKLAICYKQNEKYTKAIEVLELIDKRDDDNLAKQATREARICLQAIDWNKRPTKFKIEKLPVRGSGSHYFSDILPDGNLVISADHKTQDNKKSYKWTGRHFSKIYLIHPQSNGQFTRVEAWPELSYHEGSATFNDAYNEVVFTICNKNKIDENHCQLVSSKKINGRWTQPTLLAFVKENINYGHPFIHRDSLLFFSSNDPSGMGNYDIYFSTKNNGVWREVSALPSPINSPGNEKFPTAVEDSLFFSSDYHPGYGGLDIFKVYPRENGDWSAPINLHKPINSSVDDFGYQVIYNQNKRQIFINSSRGNPEGYDKIFYVLPKPVDDVEIDSTEIFAEKKEFKLFLSLKVFEKVYENPKDPNSKIIGRRPIPLFEGEFLQETGPKFIGREDGRYITEIDFENSYRLSLFKEGFLKSIIDIPISQLPSSNEAKEIQTISIEVELKRPFYNLEVVLQNIYYDLDKWEIREDAKPILDDLAQLLLANPEISIQIGSHTDCRADEAYNLDLSNKRAKSVVQYLIAKNIDESRLSYEGYGKSRLIEKCICEECTERQHQKNRRTTFTLIK